MSYKTYKDLKKPEDIDINPTGHWNNPKNQPSIVVDIKNAAHFKELLQYPIVIVDIWAKWCVPCKAIAPHFEILAQKHKNIKFISFVKDNIENPESIHKDQVSAIPAFFIYYKGRKVKEFIGEKMDVIEEYVNKVIYSHKNH